MLLGTISGVAKVEKSLPGNGFFNGHFQVAWTGNGYNQMNINILDAKLGGVDLSSGDEIAAFDGPICVGLVTSHFSSSSIITSQANGDSPGFTAGHSITIKFWDESNSREISMVDINNSNGQPYNPVYEVLGSAFVRLSAKVELTIHISADNKVYDGTTDAVVPAGSVIVNGLASGVDVNVMIANARFDTKNVGNGKLVTAAISITGTNAVYYAVNTIVTTIANVTAKAIAITADAKTKTYGDDDPLFTATVTSGSIAPGDFASGTLTREAGAGVGVYSIHKGSYTYGGNYNESYGPANLTITQLAVMITPVSGQTKVTGVADPVFVFLFSPALVSGDSFSGALSRQPGETVGNYSFTLGTLSAGSNYSLSIATAPQFSITAGTRAITVTVTILQSKIYGASDPVFTYSVSPALESGDSFTGALSRLSGENAGTYACTLGSLSAGAKYSIIFVPANFTIMAKPITVTAVVHTKTYNASTASTGIPTVSPALVGSDVAGFIQKFNNKLVGTSKILTPSGSVDERNGGHNYQVVFVDVHGIINALAINGRITAENKEYDGNTKAIILTRSLTGVFSGDLVSYTGGTANFDTKDVGTNKIVMATGLFLSGSDALNYTVNSIANTTASITGEDLTNSFVSASPGVVQYSDRVILTATIKGGAPVGTGLPAAKSVFFTIGGQLMKDSLNNAKIPLVTSGVNLIAVLVVPLTEPALNGSMAPGIKPVTATFNDPDINFSLQTNQATTTLTITKEDASACYTGDLLVTATGGTATTVVLRATVRDISAEPGGDGFAGDIRNAMVTFVNRTTHSIIGTAPVSLLSPSDSKAGTAFFHWTNVPPGDYLIGVVVNNYYTRDDAFDNTIVQVYHEIAYLTGGGVVIPTVSSGSYASDKGKLTNFGFNIQFDEKGTVLSGLAKILIRRTENGVQKVYQIGSTNITAVNVNIDNPGALKGAFNGAASLSDITNPLLPVELANDLTLYVNMTDRGNPGTNDGISIRLWNYSTLYYSSKLVKGQSVEMKLAGGDLIVHSSFNLEMSLATGTDDIASEFGSEASIIAYPNPSAGMVNFKVNIDESSVATLEIVSINGTIVARVFDDYVDSSIPKIINFDSKLPQGIYFYRLKTSEQVLSGKIVIAGTR